MWVRGWAILAVLMFASSAGCFGDGAGPASTAGQTGTTGGTNSTASSTPVASANLTPGVEIVNHTAKVSPSSPTVNVTWNVTFAEANASVLMEFTVLAWGNASVASPTGPESYRNETGRLAPADAPGAFNASFAPPAGSKTAYFRAFARINGTIYFSDEASATVEAGGHVGGPVSPNKTYDVNIGKTAPGSVADYDPIVLQIETGDSVRFTNKDTVGHSATDRQSAWDTGAISGGSSYTLQFKSVGRYAYRCSIHATMVGAVLDVSAR